MGEPRVLGRLADADHIGAQQIAKRLQCPAVGSRIAESLAELQQRQDRAEAELREVFETRLAQIEAESEARLAELSADDVQGREALQAETEARIR